MLEYLTKPATAFQGHRLLRSGPLVEVALAVKTANENDWSGAILVFDDLTGRQIDLDLRGTKADMIERLSRPPQTNIGRYRPRPAKEEVSESRGRGRPKLGVVAREVMLLPRQWEWLASHPGGASAFLRRLVDDAKRNSGYPEKRGATQEATYQFMLAIAGNFPGYEEATRALFADDRRRLAQCIADWPEDVRAHVMRMAFAPHSQSAQD